MVRNGISRIKDGMINTENMIIISGKFYEMFDREFSDIREAIEESKTDFEAMLSDKLEKNLNEIKDFVAEKCCEIVNEMGFTQNINSTSENKKLDPDNDISSEDTKEDEFSSYDFENFSEGKKFLKDQIIQAISLSRDGKDLISKLKNLIIIFDKCDDETTIIDEDIIDNMIHTNNFPSPINFSYPLDGELADDE
jgi:hypothetical protein